MSEVPFWLNDPRILFRKEYITELYPSNTYDLERKMNALTRTVIVFTMVGYIITRSMKFLLLSGITLALIVGIYLRQKPNQLKQEALNSMKEAFTAGELLDRLKKHENGNDVTDEDLENKIEAFTPPKPENPLMNVLPADVQDTPKRKPAKPAYTKKTEKQINDAVKENLDPRLFRNMGDELDFENSMRSFYAMPNTAVPNDQEAFAKFCYGGMTSCKDGDENACERKNYRHINY